jgi:hypothetical protein
MRKLFLYPLLALLALGTMAQRTMAQPEDPGADHIAQAGPVLTECEDLYRDLKDFYIGIIAQTRTPQAQPYPMLRKKLSGLGDVLARMRVSAKSRTGKSRFNADLESFQMKVRDYETLVKSYSLGSVKVNAYLGEIDSKINNRRDDIQKLRDNLDKANDKFDASVAKRLRGILADIEVDWKAIKSKADANAKSLKGYIFLYAGPGVSRNTMMDQTVSALRAMDSKIDQFQDVYRAGLKDFKAEKKENKKAEREEKKGKKKKKD